MEESVIVHEEEEAEVPSGVDPHEDEVNYATSAEVREAIELLSTADLRRLRMAAAHCLAGSDYAKSDDLINEATRRTMDAAEGLKGRRWPKSVPFMAYTLDVASALANDFKVSRTAAAIKLTKRSPLPTCVACHDQSRLKWHVRNAAFGSDFYVKPELHQDTDAFTMAYGGGGGKSQPKKESADRWISGSGVYRMTTQTQSLKLPDGTVLTMISLVK